VKTTNVKVSKAVKTSVVDDLVSAGAASPRDASTVPEKKELTRVNNCRINGKIVVSRTV